MGTLTSALRMQVQRRQAEVDKLLGQPPAGTAFELEILCQLRMDVVDALDFLRQSNAFTFLLEDGLARFLEASLSIQ